MTATRDTYTPEGWKALNGAARAMRYAYASGHQEHINLAHDVFRFVLERVNRDCVVRAVGELTREPKL